MFKKGMVFGVFDGLHEGHKHFLASAQKQCDELVVVVTRDETMHELKKRSAKHSFKERLERLADFNASYTVVPNDLVLGSWNVIKNHAPDIIILGHDQQKIADELEKLQIPFMYIDAHMPDKYKSSLLYKQQVPRKP